MHNADTTRYSKKAWQICQAFFCLLLISCTNLKARLDAAHSIVDSYGLENHTLTTGYFPLYWVKPPSATSSYSLSPLTIVIEGDGFAWVDRHTPSDNPTPTNPVGLRIAAGLANTNYLARPCQFISARSCDVSLWTDDRFHPDVIKSYQQALDKIKARYGTESFKLIGFSGGAYIALTLAALREDIESVTTIAGLLDPDEWTAYHGVTQLNHIRDPQQLIKAGQKTDFLHICGRGDDIIPCSHSAVFIDKAQKLGFFNHRQQQISRGSHEGIWRAALPYLRSGES